MTETIPSPVPILPFHVLLLNSLISLRDIDLVLKLCMNIRKRLRTISYREVEFFLFFIVFHFVTLD